MELRNKCVVHVELIGWLDVLCFRCSHQQTLRHFAHCQRLHGAEQILFRDVRFLLNFLVCESLAVVK